MTGWKEHTEARAKTSREAVQRRLSAEAAKRKRRKLTSLEKTRAARLRELIKAAEQGTFIANITLKRWLTKEQFDEIATRWENEQHQREQWAEKPREIKEYEERLRQALFVYHRADNYSSRGKHKTAQKMLSEADKLFERLLERLQEIVHADLSLRQWFDRDTDWTADGALGLSPDQVPRVITSRSRINQNNGFTGAQQSKADIKLIVLKAALDDLIYDRSTNDNSPQPYNKLASLLNKTDDEDDY